MVDTGYCKDSKHYQILDQQPIEIMQVLLTPDEFRGFLKGNVIKYALRKKDSEVKDMEKIAQYSTWYVKACGGGIIDPRKPD